MALQDETPDHPGPRVKNEDGARRRMTRRGFAALAGSGGASLFLAGCLGQETASGQSASGGGSGRPIVVGASLPLTSGAASDGEGFSRGIEMAIEEVNALGGVAGHPLKFEVVDAKDFAPDLVVNNFKRLVMEKKADVIVGGYQLTSGPDLDIVADAGLLYYHSNTKEVDAEKVRKNPERYWGVFQHCPSQMWYGTSLPGFFTRLEQSGVWKPRNHTMAIMRGNDQYTTGITAALEKAIEGTPWRISLVEQISLPTTEWGAMLAKIRGDAPDVVWVTDFLPADEAAFMKQFLQAPTPSLVHMQYGPSNPEFRKLAGEAANWVTWATVIPLLQDQIGNDFAARYQRKYGETVSGTAGVTYDAVHLYATAAAIAGGPDDRRRIADVTRRLVFRGVCGSNYFGFDADQTVRPYPAFTQDAGLGMPTGYYQIQGGENVLVDPAPFNIGKFKLPPWMGQA
ncbi:ABC transporter substrate-binding protein [Pseudonocardia sp. H11422]|uniref:ABC transporter substrate-binding protein n=1 Tax=Pseudonocardia sp. H11422 TaxID=2835866 RepID=UPI001BDD0858|nr:ABC transporter substrate-binding protein [Pseudonocardia sp. H11422]